MRVRWHVAAKLRIVSRISIEKSGTNSNETVLQTMQQLFDRIVLETFQFSLRI